MRISILFFFLLLCKTSSSFVVLPEGPRSIAVRHWIDSSSIPLSPPVPVSSLEKILFEKPPHNNQEMPTRYALDICCGIGDSTQELMDRLPPVWKVLGIDEDPFKISLAKKKHPSILFQAGTLAMFPSASFDRIQVHTGRMLLMDKKKKLAGEVSRILKPGGTLEVFDFSPTHAFVHDLMSLEEDVRDRYFRGWKSYDPRYHHSLFEERLEGRGYTLVNGGIIRAVFVK
jgi:SAM-dependent methyltransferase